LEVAVPFDQLIVAPRRRILLHFLVRHPVEIGSQIDAGFVSRLVRLLLEVPGWFVHKPHDNVVICLPLLSRRLTVRKRLRPRCPRRLRGNRPSRSAGGSRRAKWPAPSCLPI